jgi:hypothetical protein
MKRIVFNRNFDSREIPFHILRSIRIPIPFIVVYNSLCSYKLQLRVFNLCKILLAL